jgi:NAD(P)-dependent dehydrogenase (short-subunit alcohol dehydrogenase family)
MSLRGKRILVTGVSAGLGVETARALAAHGAHVVGAARDLVKAKAATEQVRKDADANDGGFEVVELDLANLKSVRACADGLLARHVPFDVIIANAGVMATPFTIRRMDLRLSSWHQSPRPLRSGQPDCASASVQVGG